MLPAPNHGDGRPDPLTPHLWVLHSHITLICTQQLQPLPEWGIPDAKLCAGKLRHGEKGRLTDIPQTLGDLGQVSGCYPIQDWAGAGTGPLGCWVIWVPTSGPSLPSPSPLPPQPLKGCLFNPKTGTQDSARGTCPHYLIGKPAPKIHGCSPPHLPIPQDPHSPPASCSSSSHSPA